MGFFIGVLPSIRLVKFSDLSSFSSRAIFRFVTVFTVHSTATVHCECKTRIQSWQNGKMSPLNFAGVCHRVKDQLLPTSVLLLHFHFIFIISCRVTFSFSNCISILSFPLFILTASCYILPIHFCTIKMNKKPSKHTHCFINKCVICGKRAPQ